MGTPKDPVHQAAREQAVLVAEAFCDELLVAVASLGIALSSRLRKDAGMPPRAEVREILAEPEDPPAGVPGKRRRTKAPEIDTRLEDDSGARQGEYDPSAKRSTKSPGATWETQKVQGRKAAAAKAPPVAELEEQLVAAVGPRYRGVVRDAIAAAKGGQREEDVPFSDGRGGFRAKWLETFRAIKAAG